MNENTRKKVNKNITDKDISNKIKSFYKIKRKKAINLKIFNIIGYPWETLNSLKKDIIIIKNILEKCDKLIGGKENRLLLMFLLTPFSPEPLTPMEKMSANIIINWRSELNKMGRQIYKGIDIEAFFLPQINTPYTLAKRVMINRANKNNKEKIINIIRNKKISTLPSHKQMKPIIEYIGEDIFKEIDFSPVSYLKTYIKYNQINIK